MAPTRIDYHQRRDRDALRTGWREAGWYPDLTAAAAIAAGVRAHQDRFVVFGRADGGSERVFLRQLHDDGLVLAGALRAAGVEPGTAVLIQAPADRGGATALIAAWALGACPVPLALTTPAHEVSHIVAETGATTLIATPQWRGGSLAEVLAARSAELGLERVIALGSDLSPGDLGCIEPPSPTDVAIVLYTSGSTATPKGVLHSHETLLFGLTLAPPDSTGRTLACFPAGHVASLYGVMRPLLTGDYTVIMDRWSARRAVELIEEHRITASAGTPFFLQTLLDEADRSGRDITSLRRFLCGAAAVPPALVSRADDQGIVTWRTYGSTEHPAISTGSPDDPLDKRLHTDGRVAMGNEVRIVDQDGGDVKPGDDGEIVSRGPKQFIGYQDRALDGDAFLDGTWFRTGDCGHFDEDGYLVITDRVKDIIIRGGENISAREVEEVLLRHPEVTDVAVCAGPDPVFGEVPVAVVIGSPDLESLRSWCLDAGMASFKLPARISYVEDLPRTSAGKVRKRDLRDLLG
jgi:acyl-CoA synthetase (AMP-forming)/AMP-acid ligase II